MALNFSHRPIFPAHLAEENIGQGGSQDKDIRELLPADPFGMDISSTVTAITGWLEDLGADYGGYGGAEGGSCKGDYPLFAGWNFWWNSAAMEFQTFPEKDTWADSFFPEQGLQRRSDYEGNAGIACTSTLDGAKFGTTDDASFDRFDNHWKITAVDGYLPKAYDQGVHFACTLDCVKFGAANDGKGDFNHGKGTEAVADISEAPCTLKVAKFGTIDNASFEGAKFGTTGDASFDRIDNHWKITGVDGYLPNGELEHLVYNQGVIFGCTLDRVKFDSFDRVDDNYVQSTETAADIGDISEAPCTLEDSKLGTSNDILDRDDDNHGNSTEATFDTDDISEAPHPALSYALAYLGVRDLLSVERVCKSLCHTVRNDPLLWRSIHIDGPLNEKITDDILLQLTHRAQGSLHCLNLVNCQRISDDGLMRVLLSNLRLIKLGVPGCTRLSNDGVVNCLRAFKTVAVNGIKYLRFGGRLGVTQKHFEELMSLLDIHNQVQNNRPKPHFYHRGNFYISYEDDRPIDLELCPRCQNMRLVYDCPADGCQGKNHAAELCRACTLCIARCYECGKCINDDCVYEETFSLDSLCADCWNQVPHCPERPDVGVSPLQHVIDQEPSASFHG
ncbi:F-box protein SKIP14-like [Chenopodium quinoa]|uniref:F-box domain-containing protein n=1 Tax=Chenopodium quinoa TaxID=63459 RepID=A0A803M6V1_CHEQI|nr:F-box protein SKIP14-like [Chenopodium quinoa]XP_021746747.1 F-box protein SKIP14-like [Chenopodium quinoa]